MSNVAQLVESAATMTSLVDIAAVVETRLHDAEARNQALWRELSQARNRAESAREWILTIRRSHRGKSHARTSRTIKEALVSLETRPAPFGSR